MEPLGKHEGYFMRRHLSLLGNAGRAGLKTGRDPGFRRFEYQFDIGGAKRFINSSPLWVLFFVCDSIDYDGGA
jgi:hypothetical protein